MRYLIILHDEKILSPICSEFIRRSFCSDNKLFICIDNIHEYFPTALYFQMYASQIYANQSPVIFIQLSNSSAGMENLIKDVDCYITTGNPDELDIIQIALRYKIQIRSYQHEGLNIFRDLPIDDNAEQTKSDIDSIVQKQLFALYPPQEFEYILFHQGMGESTAFFFLMREYKRQVGKKIILLCLQDSRHDFMKQCPYVNVVATIGLMIYDYLSIFYGMKDFVKLHYMPEMESLNQNWNVDPKCIKFEPLVKKFLSLDPATPLTWYDVQIPSQNINQAQQIFQQMNLKRGKTIFMTPQAINFHKMLELHLDFFIKLTNAFRVAGYDVVTNSNEQIIPNVPNIFLDFWTNVAFCGLCGNIVGVPTGWAEAICAMNQVDHIKYVSIFPSIYDESYAINRQFLQFIQRFGSDDYLTRVEIRTRLDFLSKICNKNIDCHFHILHDSEDESIDEIINIVRGV